jgi:hypothetical protein
MLNSQLQLCGKCAYEQNPLRQSQTVKAQDALVALTAMPAAMCPGVLAMCKLVAKVWRNS